MQVAATGLGVRRAFAPVGEEVGARELTRAGDGVAGLEGVAQAEAHDLAVGRGGGIEAVGEVDFFQRRAGDGALRHRHRADLAVRAGHDAVLQDGTDAVA